MFFFMVNFGKASATPSPEILFNIHLSICSLKWQCSFQFKFAWSWDIVKHQSNSQPGCSNKLCSYKKKVYFELKPSSIKHLPQINGLQKLEKLNKRPGIYSKWYRHSEPFWAPNLITTTICTYKKIQTRKIQYLHCF